MDRELITISKFLSLILRHKPETIGLQLADDGWADIDQLLHGARAHGTRLDHDLLLRVVHENDKQRFAISEDGRRIRANQGHSIAVDLALEPRTPPPMLYHGTVARFLDSIRQHGLQPGDRQHVHLSPDTRTAESVGRRRGKPIVLTVGALDMHAIGKAFYFSQNGVWLTGHVPIEFIRFPDDTGFARSI
jgi:putative RNA 2'-phosphotransferase